MAAAVAHGLCLGMCQRATTPGRLVAVVIDDEHREVVKKDRWGGRSFHGDVGWKPKAGGEGECTAAARLAFHGNRAAHEGHQPGGDS